MYNPCVSKSNSFQPLEVIPRSFPILVSPLLKMTMYPLLGMELMCFLLLLMKKTCPLLRMKTFGSLLILRIFQFLLLVNRCWCSEESMSCSPAAPWTSCCSATPLSGVFIVLSDRNCVSSGDRALSIISQLSPQRNRNNYHQWYFEQSPEGLQRLTSLKRSCSVSSKNRTSLHKAYVTFLRRE